MVIVDPEGQAEARQGRGLDGSALLARSWRHFARVDLVEDAAVAEMLRLHLGPAAEVGDGDEVELGEAARRRRGRRR